MKENKHILTPGWGKVGESFKPPHAQELPQITQSMVKVHYWVCKTGYATTVGTDRLSKKEKKMNYKYMGFSYDQGWPKKMSTGRTIFAFTPKRRKDSMDSGRNK